MERHVLTTCVYCGCGCGLYLVSDGKKLKGSYPSNNHPVSKGALCVKGWNSYEFVNRLDRLDSPLIKDGNKLNKTEWASAISKVSNKLNEIKEKHGPESLAFLSSAKTTNEENYLMMKLARAVFKTNNIDHCARLCHSPTVIGLSETFGSGAMTNSINEFEDAEVFLVTGSDTTSQHPLIGSRIVNRVIEKKSKLIVFDPRKIKLSQHADVYAQFKNGTDVAWINGMMNIIIEEKLYNKQYIEERVDDFDKLRALVKEYTPDVVEKITSIKKDKLITSARMYAKAKTAMIVYSMGITQHTTGVDNVRSLANLAMLTGNVGFTSSGVNPLRGQNNVQGACDMGALPDVYSGYGKVTNKTIREKFEASWDVTNLPDKVGLTSTEIFRGIQENKIKALYIMGENPVLSEPDGLNVRAALNKLEFLVVQDIFLTETAEYADVVLAGSSFAEKNGTFTNTERRVERIRKAIECVGNSKEDWKILCEIAKLSGYNKMSYKNTSEVFDEIADVTPVYRGISYKRLDPWGIQWPCLDDKHPGTEFLHKDKFTKGKGTFIPCHYVAPDELPDKEYDFLLSTGRVYWHWHTGTMTRRTSTLDREVPTAYVEMHPENAAKLNILSGDFIKITSRRGSIEVKVKITEKVAKMSLFLPFHFKEASANVLTNPAYDKTAKIPEYKVCAVKVEKICL